MRLLPRTDANCLFVLVALVMYDNFARHLTVNFSIFTSLFRYLVLKGIVKCCIVTVSNICRVGF